jgi:hypothetical protein
MESNATTKWFVLATSITLAICLSLACICAGVSFLARGLLTELEEHAGPAIEGSLEPEVTRTQSPRPTPSPTVLTQEVIPTESDINSISSVIVPARDPIALKERLSGLADIPRVLSESAEPIPIGTVESFWVSNQSTLDQWEIAAEMVYATDHVYFWIERGVQYDLDDVIALVDTFEAQIYPTNRAFFGNEWSPGVDGDPHLYMLYARRLGGTTAGLFSSVDSYSPLVNRFSNGHEMFYLNADTVGLWESYTYGVLAHEFEHMIQWTLDPNEETWLDEGFAELAVFLNGYDIGGLDFVFTSNPDIPLTRWPGGSGDSSAHYGQAFLLMTYFLDQFGPTTTQALVARPENGLESLDATLDELGIINDRTDHLLTADDVYLDFAGALYLNDPTVEDGRYAYQSYTPPAPRVVDTFNRCPFSSETREINPYGIDYLQFRCPGAHTLVFDTQTTVKVVPSDPHSGEYAFWTNRGNESDMTLTRAFDFRGVEGPIYFDYWVWYDIEEGWDYVYLEISIDGGATWDILTTPSGTADDPSGSSYGWGYTGQSGNLINPTWIQESVDLSAYVGEEALLRFEYITDAAVNGEGLLLDDLEIDALGYHEDFESGDGGWEPEGFVLLFNLVPQTYRLLLIEEGLTTSAREIRLDEAGHGEVRVIIGSEVEQVTLVVIATTRETWQPATYHLQIQP